LATRQRAGRPHVEYSLAPFEQRVFEIINAVREEEGLPLVKA
jgi:hypothetical protein